MFRFSFSAILCCVVAVGLCGLVIATAAEPAPNWQTAPVNPPAIVAPASAYAAQAEAAAAAAAKPKAASKNFKSALATAATQAQKDGTITRWQLARIRMAIAFRPDAMAEAQACCVDQAMNDGLMRSPGDAELDGFDWSQLLAFLKEFLPMILQIIAVLG